MPCHKDIVKTSALLRAIKPAQDASAAESAVTSVKKLWDPEPRARCAGVDRPVQRTDTRQRDELQGYSASSTMQLPTVAVALTGFVLARLALVHAQAPTASPVLLLAAENPLPPVKPQAHYCLLPIPGCQAELCVRVSFAIV